MLFSVFAFAAVEPWAAAAVEAALFLLAGAAFRDNRFLRLPEKLLVPFALVLLLSLTAALQLVPLPRALWAIAGDERATLASEAARAEVLLRSEPYRTDALTGAVLPEDRDPVLTPPPPGWIPATFAPRATARALVALLAFLAFLLLLERAAENGREDLRRLALATGIAGVAAGAFALVQFRPGAQKVLGVRESVHAASAFGPFINENNGMGFVNLALCLLYYLLYRKARENPHPTNRLGLLVLASALAAFHGALLLIRTTGAGFWTPLLLPVILALRLLKERPRALRAASALFFAALALAGGAMLLWGFTDLHGRMGIWKNALSGGHLLLGNGLGAFAERFPSVLEDTPTRSAVLWLYPENEYLQLLFEGGIAGAVAGLAALLWVFRLGVEALAARGGAFLLVPALWGEALHAVTDFHFHLWPVLFAYTLAAALAAGAANRSRRSPRRSGGSEAPLP